MPENARDEKAPSDNLLSVIDDLQEVFGLLPLSQTKENAQGSRQSALPVAFQKVAVSSLTSLAQVCLWLADSTHPVQRLVEKWREYAAREDGSAWTDEALFLWVLGNYPDIKRGEDGVEELLLRWRQAEEGVYA